MRRHGPWYVLGAWRVLACWKLPGHGAGDRGPAEERASASVGFRGPIGLAALDQLLGERSAATDISVAPRVTIVVRVFHDLERLRGSSRTMPGFRHALLPTDRRRRHFDSWARPLAAGRPAAADPIQGPDRSRDRSQGARIDRGRQGRGGADQGGHQGRGRPGRPRGDSSPFELRILRADRGRAGRDRARLSIRACLDRGG